MSLLDALLEDALPASVLLNPQKEIWIAIRTDGAFGDGSRQNPFNGTTVADFDRIMAPINGHVEENTVIHLGPGLFRTEGGAGNAHASPAWLPLPGQKIIGAGIYATTLRLVAPNAPGTDPNKAIGYSAVSSNASVPGLEVSDLTIDLDLGNQRENPVGFPNVSLRAIYVNGANIRVRRVRVINFGTRTPIYWKGKKSTETTEGMGQSHESFPITVAGSNGLVEDCIAEQPFCGTARETTLLSVGSDVNGEPPGRLRNGSKRGRTLSFGGMGAQSGHR